MISENACADTPVYIIYHPIPHFSAVLTYGMHEIGAGDMAQ